MTTSKWPADMIDTENLYELLGHQSADPEMIGEEAYRRLLDFETAVDDAHVNGRISRFAAKDPRTGAVVGYAFKRADVKKILLTRAFPV